MGSEKEGMETDSVRGDLMASIQDITDALGHFEEGAFSELLIIQNAVDLLRIFASLGIDSDQLLGLIKGTHEVTFKRK